MIRVDLFLDELIKEVDTASLLLHSKEIEKNTHK